MTDKVRIRKCSHPLTEEERHTINTIDVEYFGEPYDKDDATRWWIAWRGREPVGFSGYRILKDACNRGLVFFCRAAVVLGARGQGLQQKMIRAKINDARRRGFHVAISYTDTENIASANNLITCGFVLYEPCTAYALPTSLYFWRDL